MRRSNRHRTVVLLSGGMDSATCLAWAARRGSVVALTVEYGQRHRRELDSARSLVRHFRVRAHLVVRLPLATLARSSLTRPGRSIPRPAARRTGIPSTYVPARNTVLLGLALSLAESTGADGICIGANAIDYSGYPDCRPEFLRAFEKVARLGTRAGVESRRPIRVLAPLVRLSKAQIVRKGDALGVPWELTWSCYRGGRVPCGACDACALRAKGFREAGRVDPAV
ncbi:MAG TPA: 7-cyano-7-deazaguanine synthase QueC [Thermoplasmata archaeon]|nr:7-cyano-7-deazaguanine synthase QueC [Thermoplasmata archaeon]